MHTPNNLVVLRPFQREAIEAARDKFRSGHQSTLIVLPTGAGKTVVFAEVARTAVERGNRVLVLAHRNELLVQATSKIENVAPDLSIALEQATNRASFDAEVVVASVQTFSRGNRFGHWPRDHFGLIVVDEAHHAAADSYRRVLTHFSAARVLGFTATPDRSDGKRILGTVFDSVAYERSMLDLMREGYLAPLLARVVRVDAFDLEGTPIVGGDIDEADIARALGRDGVLHAVAGMLLEHAESRSTLVFVAGVERARELAELLHPHGGAVAVDGGTPTHERAARFDAFSEGAVQFLVNVGVATEGTDLPRCACVAIVRPTMSRGLFVQMVGRGTRLYPGKSDCLLLNFVPSNTRHRLVQPTDALFTSVSEVSEHARELAVREPQRPLHEIGSAAQREAPARARAAQLATYRSTLETYDPFGLIDPFADLELALRVDAAGGQDVPEVRATLLRLGLPRDLAAQCPPGLALALNSALEARRRSGLCSYKVARILHRHRLNPNVSIELGKVAMQAIAAEQWRRVPTWLREDPRFVIGGESHAA